MTHVGDELPFTIFVDNEGADDAVNAEVVLRVSANGGLTTASVMGSPDRREMPPAQSVPAASMGLMIGTVPAGDTAAVESVVLAIESGALIFAAELRLAGAIAAQHAARVEVEDNFDRIPRDPRAGWPMRRSRACRPVCLCRLGRFEGRLCGAARPRPYRRGR